MNNDGYKGTDERRIWYFMIQRCHNEEHPSYPNYGKRGVVVCDEWKDPSSGFQVFLKDMGRRPDKNHTLDRIDPSGPYSPTNCRWATIDVQARNKRRPPVFHGQS